MEFVKVVSVNKFEENAMSKRLFLVLSFKVVLVL